MNADHHNFTTATRLGISIQETLTQEAGQTLSRPSAGNTKINAQAPKLMYKKEVAGPGLARGVCGERLVLHRPGLHPSARLKSEERSDHTHEHLSNSCTPWETDRKKAKMTSSCHGNGGTQGNMERVNQNIQTNEILRQ